MSKPVIRVNMNGPEGNIFDILSKARQALRNSRSTSQMITRATRSENYEKALTVVREYVEIEVLT